MTQPGKASYNASFRPARLFRCIAVMEAPMDDLPDKPASSDHQDKKPKKDSGSGGSRRDSLPGVSRRDFLKISGVSAAVPLVSQMGALAMTEGEVAAQGPGKVPATLD